MQPLPRDVDAAEASYFHLAAGASCPAPELLMPAREGTLPPELGARTRWHIEHCRFCHVLADAFEVIDVELTPAERARVDARTGVRGTAWSRGRIAALATAAAVVLTAGAAIVLSALARGVELPPVRSMQGDRALPVLSYVLALNVPEIELPETALVLRGTGPDAYVDRLAAALVPFRRRDYARAAVQLESVAARHPSQPHAAYYAGLARLLAGQPADAIAPLSLARRLAADDPHLQESASWYLAVAFERSGGLASALPALAGLCAEGGVRRADACGALREAARSSLPAR